MRHYISESKKLVTKFSCDVRCTRIVTPFSFFDPCYNCCVKYFYLNRLTIQDSKDTNSISSFNSSAMSNPPFEEAFTSWSPVMSTNLLVLTKKL